MDPGYGKCVVCYKTMHLATPTDVVYRGKPERAYRVHKACKKAPVDKEQPVVVSDPAVFAGSQLKATPAPEEPLPSMPTKEQTGRRRKATKSDEATGI